MNFARHFSTGHHGRFSILTTFVFLALGVTGCPNPDPPAPNACEGMPEPPKEDGVPIGTCPFWLAPSTENACATGIAGFVDAPLAGPDTAGAVACRYVWSDPSTSPTPADIANLPDKSEPDCKYLTPQASADVFTNWARGELRAAVGARLPASKDGTSVRVVLFDTVGEKSTGVLPSGAQHGRTLANMAADLACDSPTACPIQVKSVLALPRQLNPNTGRPEVSIAGGMFGLLSDVTDAMWAEMRSYRAELAAAAQNPTLAKTTPLRLVAVSAFGFDNVEGESPCSDSPWAQTSSATVRALADAYTAAACLGTLHVSAAGNSTGGGAEPMGMMCPAQWDKAIAPSDSACEQLWGSAEWSQIQLDFAAVAAGKATVAEMYTSKSTEVFDHLLSVAAVDYHGLPLSLSRPAPPAPAPPGSCAEAVGLGFGGIGWVDDKDVPPFLTGTSVSAALVGARLAVRWHGMLGQVATDVVQGAVSEANTVPFSRMAHCDGAREWACPSDLPWLFEPANVAAGQNPLAPDAVKDLLIAREYRVSSAYAGETVCTQSIPHCVLESRAASSDVWPQPVDPLCVKCGVFVNPTPGYRDPELWLDGNPSIDVNDVTGAALVLEDENGQVVLTKPLDAAVFSTPATIALTGVDTNLIARTRAWLSAYMRDGRTISQQMFVID